MEQQNRQSEAALVEAELQAARAFKMVDTGLGIYRDPGDGLYYRFNRDSGTMEETSLRAYTKDDAIADLLSCLKDMEGFTLDPSNVDIVHRAELALMTVFTVDPADNWEVHLPGGISLDSDYFCVSGHAANGGHCSDRECVCNLPEGFRTEVKDEDIRRGDRAVVRWIADGRGFSGNISAVYEPDPGQTDYRIEVEPISYGAERGHDPPIDILRSEVVGIQVLKPLKSR